MQLSACVAGCVPTKHALGSGVPKRSMHKCAHAARTTCAHHPCLALIWINTVYELPSLVVLQRWWSWWIQRWCATWGRALAALHAHRSIDLL